MRWMPRMRMLFARRPVLAWVGVALLTAMIALSLQARESAANRRRDSWGKVASVIVADRRINPGEPIAGSASVRQVPVALVPASAVTALPIGATARQLITAGEMLVGPDLAPDASPLSLLPHDWLAIPIEDTTSSGFQVGDSAAVLAGGRIITAKALVIERLDGAILLGVPADVAGPVAEAANQHLVTVALSATPPPR